MISECTYVCFTTIGISEDLYLNPLSHEAAPIAQTKTSKASLEIWHRQLEYIPLNAIKQLSKCNMVIRMKISPDDTTGQTCVPCLEGKQMQTEIPSQSDITHPRVLHCVYSNLCGPMQMQLCQGELYFLTFIDGSAHHIKVKLLATKSETCQIYIVLIK